MLSFWPSFGFYVLIDVSHCFLFSFSVFLCISGGLLSISIFPFNMFTSSPAPIVHFKLHFSVAKNLYSKIQKHSF